MGNLCSLDPLPFISAPGDYEELINVTLTIPVGVSQRCQPVTVIGDVIREPPNEAFTVQITPENANDENIIPESFRVTIVEMVEDGK